MADNTENTGPLKGIRVFDMTRILAGPTGTQVLADLGADVIKVERPGAGDDTRRWGPPFVQDADGNDTTESAYYLAANRGKRSITLDITQPEGLALAKRLIGECDVLVENFKTGDLARRGLDYEQVSKEFPRLVYCSITGFGQTGPYAKRAGYDLVVQAMGGIMAITGDADGEPAKVGVGVSDIMCGMYGMVAILAALRHRDATGKGQHIDMSLLDSQVAWLVNAATNYLVGGPEHIQGRMGTAHPNIVPYQSFPCSDGYFILAAANDGQFSRFCAFAGVPELAEDPRFGAPSDRVRNREALIPLLREITVLKTRQEWVEGLADLAVPCAPVYTIDQVFEDPQVKHRGMAMELPHPLAGSGSVPVVASPIRMSETPVWYRNAPPTLGQHTEEVLREVLGMGESEINKLRENGIV